ETEAPRTGAARRHPRPGRRTDRRVGPADAFADLIRKRSTGTLSEWLTRGEASPDPDLRRVAAGIRRACAAGRPRGAARAGTGAVGGHVNRLKTVKRQMYGRAGFVLLRARVLNAA